MRRKTRPRTPQARASGGGGGGVRGHASPGKFLKYRPLKEKANGFKMLVDLCSNPAEITRYSKETRTSKKDNCTAANWDANALIV